MKFVGWRMRFVSAAFACVILAFAAVVVSSLRHLKVGVLGHDVVNPVNPAVKHVGISTGGSKIGGIDDAEEIQTEFGRQKAWSRFSKEASMYLPTPA